MTAGASPDHATILPYELMPMYRVRLIFAEAPDVLSDRKDVQVADFDRAKDRARHELDLERYLAEHRQPPGLVPCAVQIRYRGRVVWQLTEAERAHEREQ